MSLTFKQRRWGKFGFFSVQKNLFILVVMAALITVGFGSARAYTCYVDADGDGYGDPGNPVDCPDATCACQPGLVDNDFDCDDTDPQVNPGATEVCDDKDNNCDGNIDEDGNIPFYADTDGDGYGDAGNVVYACSPPPGYVANDFDCDDGDSQVNPNATEVCDDKDNNCDGNIDEGVMIPFYGDMDGDGYGDAGNVVYGCSPPPGYVTNDFDCNDMDPLINPDAEDIPGDDIDQDCDGSDAQICCDVTGDVNGDGLLNILDITYNIAYLYNGGPSPFCTVK